MEIEETDGACDGRQKQKHSRRLLYTRKMRLCPWIARCKKESNTLSWSNQRLCSHNWRIYHGGLDVLYASQSDTCKHLVKSEWGTMTKCSSAAVDWMLKSIWIPCVFLITCPRHTVTHKTVKDRADVMLCEDVRDTWVRAAVLGRLCWQHRLKI